jgi:hypothetical protein
MLCPPALVSQGARNPLDPAMPPVISKWCAIEKEGRGLGPEDFHDFHDCHDGHDIGREARQTSRQADFQADFQADQADSQADQADSRQTPGRPGRLQADSRQTRQNGA